MVRTKRIFTSGKSPTYQKADTKNHEGFPAFSRSLEEQTLAVLVNNTLSPCFYVGEQKISDDTVNVLSKMADQDPEFLAKALVYARTKGLMKLAPTVGLAILSAKGNGEKKTHFRKVFKHVIRTPDDLREFVAFCRTGRVRKGLGGVAKTYVQHFLRHMSEYHAVKYGSAKSKDITVRDILRMTHPRPKDEAMKERFGWLVNGWEDVGDTPSETNPQIWALEKIKRSDDVSEIVKLIADHRLTWEVVVPSVQKMTTAIWRALMKEMPYMALLRNLNTMNRHGVFEDKASIKFVAEKLSDPDNVARSKQFPFRFSNAFNAFDGPQEIRDALVDALEVSFKNVAELSGRVCISNDVSYSMSGLVSQKGKARYCDIAGLFAATFFKKSKDVVLLPADTHVRFPKVSRRSTVMDIAKKIGQADGGTDLGAALKHLIKTKDKVDTYIGITDGEDWAGRGFLSEWEDYKRKVSPNAKAVLITISPYRHFTAPTGYPDVWFVMGWSDAVLKYIPMVLSEGQGQIEDVRKIDLDSLE